MAVQVQLCFLLFGTCLFSFLLLLECKKLEGYAFPVFPTKECPGNKEDWKNRSSVINCTESNGYMCLPNENFTELLEFCYIYPRILVQKDLCLYLVKRFSKVDSYNCSKFRNGCPKLNYFSSDTYIHPNCMEVENGCFSAEPNCKRQPVQSKTSIDDTTLAIILGISISACLLCILVFYVIRKNYRIKRRRNMERRHEESLQFLQNMSLSKKRALPPPRPPRPSWPPRREVTTSGTHSPCSERPPRYPLGNLEHWFSKRRRNLERNDEEMHPLFTQGESMDNYKESPNDIAMFNQWKQDDSFFISTKACEEVEKLIKGRKLVFVAGHSGSGKSAIIQHIALQYREQGWTIRQVTKVEDIEEHLFSFRERKTIFVFNDPFGKESCDEILINSWHMFAKDFKFWSKTTQILMSCRNNIMSNTRIIHHLVNQSDIVDIDSEIYKFSVGEKHQILKQYTSDMNLSDKDRDKIVQVHVEKYFPLLCKLYSRNEEYKSKGTFFFTEPLTVLKEEIIGFSKNDRGKYCALALLIFFNDDLCISDLSENKDTKEKFKHTLKLCGLPDNTSPSSIEDNLDSLKDVLVRKIGDRYHFYHDLVSEISTQVFITDYPDETIKSADIGILRKRVRIGNCKEHNDSFTIYLRDNYIEKLAKRLSTELIGNSFIDVVLTPCMKIKSVIEAFTNIFQKDPEKLQLLFEKKEHKLTMRGSFYVIERLYLSKLAFFSFKKDITPLFALIVFGHTDFSLECLKSAQQIISIPFDSSLFHAVCCNGSMKLFHFFAKDRVKQFMKNNIDNKWGEFYPIHTLNFYHNYEILEELLKSGIKINPESDTGDNWTPLLLAVGNDTQKYGDYDHEESGATRRDKTVQFLLRNGVDINLCTGDGTSPLYIACKKGYDSTVQLLLSKGADINLCKIDGTSPLFTACEKGHDITVQLLLSKKADINLNKGNGTSPLHAACKNGHDSIVQLLLTNGADINLCSKDGASPLHEACKNGHNRTIQLLLSNGANINSCQRNRISPLCLACESGHDSTVQLLLNHGAELNLRARDGTSALYIACENGHDSTVQLLLRNGADVNLFKDDESSPLFIGCENLHDSTLQLLLSKGANINSCNIYGSSSLHKACQEGRNSTVQLLLNNGADINLCTKNGASPLSIACENGHDSIVQFLLSNGAEVNLLKDDESSPLHIACENGHDSTVQHLLSYGADINLCSKDGASPFYKACKNGHYSTGQLLLKNGANINLCSKDGASPLFKACKNGYYSTVQLLLKNGADINLCTKDGASPLFKACKNGHYSTVQLLLKNGANINSCTKDGVSPLYIACQNEHDGTVQLLLSNGADINSCTKDGANPLLRKQT